MMPTVAIVGRPNVGKSTLFNCLTASRSALVSSFPGMTRDRQYGQATIGQHRFIAIDTGGLTDEPDEINQLTAQQAWLAIEEADQILFVVDGRAGLTAADIQITEKLRRFTKPILLVVNKMEDVNADIATAEFYQLGLAQLISISAAHKRGIDALGAALFAHVPPNPDESDTVSSGITLALIGRPNVGKSTLTNRILGEERVIVFDEPGTTRDSITIDFKRHDQQYTLIDTAGVRQRGKILATTEKFSVVKTLQAIEESQVVLFIMDAREGVTEQDLRLIGFILETGKALVIAINKWDGLSIEQRDHARATVDRRLKFIPFVRIHYISALHGTGVGDLFKSILEAHASAYKPLPTPKLTQFLEDAVRTHTPPLVRGRRIKLRYAHAGGHNPPVVVIHGNQVASLPKSYKQYLANTLQRRLKLYGTPLHLEFKSGDNPFKEKRNTLTPRQQRKKQRLMRHHHK